MTRDRGQETGDVWKLTGDIKEVTDDRWQVAGDKWKVYNVELVLPSEEFQTFWICNMFTCFLSIPWYLWPTQSWGLKLNMWTCWRSKMFETHQMLLLLFCLNKDQFWFLLMLRTSSAEVWQRKFWDWYWCANLQCVRYDLNLPGDGQANRHRQTHTYITTYMQFSSSSCNQWPPNTSDRLCPLATQVTSQLTVNAGTAWGWPMENGLFTALKHQL